MLYYIVLSSPHKFIQFLTRSREFSEIIHSVMGLLVCSKEYWECWRVLGSTKRTRGYWGVPMNSGEYWEVLGSTGRFVTPLAPYYSSCGALVAPSSHMGTFSSHISSNHNWNISIMLEFSRGMTMLLTMDTILFWILICFTNFQW